MAEKQGERRIKKKWWLLAAVLALLLVCWIGCSVWRTSKAGILRAVQQKLPELETQALACLKTRQVELRSMGGVRSMIIGTILWCF